MDKIKRMLEILDETIAYYSEDTSRRSVSQGGACFYDGPNGKRCAFSRVVAEDKMDNLTEYYPASHFVDEAGKLDWLLKPEYHGFEPQFWCNLQKLHDHDNNWDKEGLTPVGARNAKIFKDDILAGKGEQYVYFKSTAHLQY